MTTVQVPGLSGQDINLAARATRRALEVLLAEQGASFPPLAAMNAIASRGALVSREALVRTLAGALDVDVQTVETIVHGLTARGLVRQSDDGHLQFTEAGGEEHQRLSRIVGGLTAQLYRDFAPEELATARQVLVTLTERADAHVAAALG